MGVPANSAINAVAGPGERWMTPGLALFLLTVLVVVGLGLRQRYPCPDLLGAVQMLADGDLDGAERTRMLRRVVDLARGADGVTDRWAGLLATIALADRAAHAEFAAGLWPPTAAKLPELSHRPWLDLGEPALANVLAASVFEAADELEQAEQRWQVAEVQSRLAGHAFPRELAVAAQRRLAAARLGR